MKTSLVSLLCYISLITVSDAVTVWYDKAGICNGFYSHVPSVGCGDEGDRMTSINVTDEIAKARGRDSSFNGYSVGGTKLVDENGNFVASTGELIAAIDRLGGTGITSVGASYSCEGGKQQNDSGACYDAGDGAATYIDFETGNEEGGWQVLGGNMGRGGTSGSGGGKGNCQYYRDFDVIIHWAPRDYEDIVTTPYNYSTGAGTSIHIDPRPIDWTGIPKNVGTSSYHYHWDGGLAPGRWTQNGSLVKQIPLPSSHNGWTLRGLYLMSYALPENTKEPKSSASSTEKQEWINYLWTVRARADNLVSEATNTYSTARLGFLPGQSNYEYINVEDDGAWGNSYTRWSIWSCEPITTVHMYAGWTKNCANNMCNLTVKANGLHNNNDRGDVFYDTGSNKCPDGTTPNGYNTYNPSCSGAGTSISYSFTKYRDVDGNPVTCINYPSAGSCTINGNSVLLPTPSNLVCGSGNSNYKFYKWTTQDTTLHDAGTTVDCTANVLGTSPANITGVLCNCNNTSSTSGGGARCTIICSDNGGEYTPGGGGNGDGESEGKLAVELDLRGGTMVGKSGSDVTEYYDKGEVLSVNDLVEAGVTRSDGAVIAGLKGSGDASGRTSQTISDRGDGSGGKYEVVWNCPDGMEMNANGVCVDPDGEYLTPRGDPVPPSQLTCWRNNYTENYCYWKVNVTFHDKPVSGASAINVYYDTSKSNNGKTLYCNGGSGCTTTATDKWCNEYHEMYPTVCRRINMPRANGYHFRGYYYNVPDDIITQTSTTNGGAYNNFFPKNLNANDISITGHAIVVMSDHIVDPDTSINIDVYGGWARDCDTSDPNVVCNLKTGIWWNVYDNLGKGDVRYDTGCVNGFVQTAGNGTYKPTCESEKGEAGNISYSFIDQFGNPVSCNGPAASCELGSTFSLTSKPAVQTACGSDYELKYLITNRSNWYKPSKSNVSCSTNELGSEPRIIYGTVCNKFCTIGQHYDNLHATCVAANQGDTPNSLGRLGISMPPISTTPNSQYYGWYIVNGSELIENLWATCSGGTCTKDCPTLRCDDGYGLTVDSTGPHCVEKGNEGGGSTFTCPTLSSLGVNPSGLTVSGPSQSGQRCTYTVSCGTNPRQELVGNGTTISCEGDGSTSANGCNAATLRAQLNGFSCQIACPKSVGSEHNVEVRFVERSDSNTCKYKVFCHADCATGGSLLYDDAIIGTCSSIGNIYVTCNGDDCFSPISPNPDVPSTNINPSLFFSKYNCARNPELTKCPGVAWFKAGGHLNAGYVSLANPNNYTLSSGITMIPQSSTPTTGQCRYNMGCESGTLTNGGSIFVCNGATGDSACQVATMRSHLSSINHTCGTSGGTFTCPTSGFGTLPTGVSFVNPPAVSGQTCTYTPKCTNGGTLTGGNSTFTCTGTTGTKPCTTTYIGQQLNNYSCPTGGDTLTCPTGSSIPTITHGNISKTGSSTTSCSYLATCTDTGYTCDTSTGLCGTKTCTSASECNTLMSQYQSSASTLCQASQTQTCPTSGWTMGTGVGFNTPSLSGQTCTYTPKCTDGGTLYKNNAISSGDTITCTLGGSGTAACTTDNLQTKFRDFYCVTPVTCPTVGTFGTLEHGTIGAPTKPDVGSCKYTLQCDTGYELQGDATLQCSGATNCGTASLSTQLGFRQCNSLFTCPTATLSGGHGTISKQQNGDQCNYTLTCNSGYAEPNNNTTHTCTGTACNSGSDSVTTWANGLECKEKFSCPSTVTMEHGTVTWASTKNGTECTATVNCPTPSYSCSLGSNCTKTCSSDENCELRRDYYVDHSSDACGFTCPNTTHIATLVDRHISNISRSVLADDKCKYTFSGCETCFTPATSYGLSKTCQREECNNNSTGWLNEAMGFCSWTGGSGCGAAQ